MEEDRVNNSAGALLEKDPISGKAVAPNDLEGEFGLGAMIHEADCLFFQQEPELWDSRFFPHDIHNLVEDFYGPTENACQGDDSAESVGLSDFLAQNESMDWQASNEGDSEIAASDLDLSLTPPVPQMNNDSSRDSQSNSTLEMVGIDKQDDLGDASSQKSAGLLVSREFEYSHLYPQNTPLVRDWSSLRKKNKNRFWGRDNSHNQEPPKVVASPTQPTSETPLPSLAHEDNSQQDDQHRPLTTDLNETYQGAHLDSPQSYFYPIIELNVLLCTVCHLMCPNRQSYIDQHLAGCHNLPRIRHVITGCLGILPEDVPQDQNVVTMGRRLKNEIRTGRPDIDRISFLEVSEAYACPAAGCCYVDHDSRRILSHCRSVHDISTFSKSLGRVSAHNLQVSKTTKISVTIREPAPESPSALFTTLSDISSDSPIPKVWAEKSRIQHR